MQPHQDQPSPKAEISAPQWAVLDAALADALELPREERLPWMREHLAGHPDILAEAVRMLEQADEAEAFFDRQSVTMLTPGARLGNWKLERELGRGGMGVVWLAHRTDGKTEMRAAVKLLNTPFATPALLARFEREKQILASLQHPNIAHLLDASIGPRHLPNFVLEYIDGKPLPDHCESRQLSLVQRIRLARQLLDALQYAHSKLVVHRDLKPGNILCTEMGVPKLLDFGIARLLDEQAGKQLTETVYRALSVDYASPEHLRGEDASTSADLYSMGLVLYETFTGERARRWSQRSIAAILRECESYRLPAQPSLPADLRAILWKATEPDPALRYATASEFSADLGRLLDGLPVSARTASFRYVAMRHLRRNAWVATAAGVALAAVLAGTAAALYQAREADKQRDVAVIRQQEAERAAAEALTARRATQEALDRAEELHTLSEDRREDLLRLSFSFLDETYRDIASLPGATPVRAQLLKRTLGHLERLETSTPDDPNLLLMLIEALGNLADTYAGQNSNLGERDQAQTLLHRRKALIDRLANAQQDSLLTERLLLDNEIRQIPIIFRGDSGQRHASLAALEPRVARLLDRSAPSRTLYRFGVVYYFQRAVFSKEASLRLRYYQRVLDLASEDERRFGGEEVCWRSIALAHKYIAGSLPLESPAYLHHAQHAVAYDEKRVALNQMNATARIDLTFSRSTLALALESKQRTQEANEIYRDIYRQRLSLLDVDPENQWYQSSLWYPLVRAAYLDLKSEDGEALQARYAELKRLADRYQAPLLAQSTIAMLEGELMHGTAPAAACKEFQKAQSTHLSAAPSEQNRFPFKLRLNDRLSECEPTTNEDGQEAN
ncbi:MAG: serine/threonine protein kinase [Bryobacterales bacterium]|nr:serine/threonine protein kinase [Bryobacterales bacterium]